MDASEQALQSISISLPAIALTQINRWAEESGLPYPKFYTVALTLGARIQAISLEPIGFLTPKLRKQAAQNANTSITPETLLQIVSGNKEKLSNSSKVETDGQVVVDLPADVLAQLNQAAERSGITPAKLYALALATGVQLMASSLAPDSSVPFEVTVQMTEGTTPAEMLMQAIMERYRQVQFRKRQGDER